MKFDTGVDILRSYLLEGKDGVVTLMARQQNVDIDLLLLYCAQHGDIDGVVFAVAHCDPKAHNSKALRLAVERGHYKVVEFLIPHSHVAAEKSSALVRAVKNNDVKMVELLLPFSNARDEKSYALYCAIVNNNIDIAKLLWPVSNLGAVGEQLRALRYQNRRMDFTHVLTDWPVIWQREACQQAVNAIRSDFISQPARKM